VSTVDNTTRELLERAYSAFNARDIDSAATMHTDVAWPNRMEGGYVHGHEEVRAYWTRQWQLLDPHVEPLKFAAGPSGRVIVEVHQVVPNVKGQLLMEGSCSMVIAYISQCLSWF
jgi:hypothetical protein